MIDVSESMGEEIVFVKNYVERYVTALSDENTSNRVGLATFNDIASNDTTLVQRLSNVNSFDDEALNNLKLASGLSQEPVLTTVMMRLEDIGDLDRLSPNWRDGVPRQLIVFSDEDSREGNVPANLRLDSPAELRSRVKDLVGGLNNISGPLVEPASSAGSAPTPGAYVDYLDVPFNYVPPAPPVVIHSVLFESGRTDTTGETLDFLAVSSGGSSEIVVDEELQKVIGSSTPDAEKFGILDNVLEQVVAPTYSIYTMTPDVTEGQQGDTTVVDFWVSRSQTGAAGVAKVDLVVDMTPIGGAPASPQFDFFGLPQSVAFAPGETSVQISVEILGDFEIESDEVISVSLANVRGLDDSALVANVAAAKATVRILDDDAPFTFVGTDEAEEILGSGRNDSLDGRGGDDTITSFSGNDTVLGGTGDDEISGGENEDSLSGNEGLDTISGDDGNDRVSGGPGMDRVTGGAGNDTISGDAGDDRLAGNGGFDQIDGGTGDDQLWGGKDDDILVGGPEQLVAIEDTDADTISGDAGNDSLVGGAGPDRIKGGSGKDTIDAGAGNDVVAGGDGADDISAGPDEDRVWGGKDGDKITGGTEDDFLSGDAGPDTIDGGDGADTIHGGNGDDRLKGGPGPDEIVGGMHADVISGGSGSDDLSGSGGDDRIWGGKHGDLIEGGSGNDTLYGDADGDTIVGGAGNDEMIGGGGADVFLFDAARSDQGRDTIRDFSPIDTIRISNATMNDIEVRQDGNVTIFELDRTEVVLKGRDVPQVNEIVFEFV